MSETIILFDFEYTAWEGSRERRWSEPWEHREIIQIAALRIAARDGMEELGCFERLIRPARNPALSPYITALTGIEQRAVDATGLPFAAGFADFYAFCEAGRLPIFCYGDDVSVLAENFALNGMPFAPFPAGVYDIRAVFARAGIDTARYTSGTVHQAAGAAFAHAAHNALNDTRSMAAALRRLASTGRIPTGWPGDVAALQAARFSLPGQG